MVVTWTLVVYLIYSPLGKPLLPILQLYSVTNSHGSSTRILIPQATGTVICDCLSKNPPSSHLLVFREIPF